MKVYNNLKMIVAIAFHFTLFMSCSNTRSKNKYLGTGVACNNLIREKYIVGSWGALSADIYADYLTDSIHFRVYIGTHGDEENFGYDCAHDSIHIIRLSIIGVESPKIIDKIKVFSISSLKKEGVFE